ncbi:antitoxin [Lapillicoccus sp.]|uniref:type II toxin-antitoxin system VapB family antitoxin n=1 Tax=Lapillicoccus sp. TaxID=1909287 RepID=UPI0032643F23
MPDVLIRNFSSDDLTLLDEQAARLGISRTEHLRRHLHREARRSVESVTANDLREMVALLPDLADDSITNDAWA